MRAGGWGPPSPCHQFPLMDASCAPGSPMSQQFAPGSPMSPQCAPSYYQVAGGVSPEQHVVEATITLKVPPGLPRCWLQWRDIYIRPDADGKYQHIIHEPVVCLPMPGNEAATATGGTAAKKPNDGNESATATGGTPAKKPNDGNGGTDNDSNPSDAQLVSEPAHVHAPAPEPEPAPEPAGSPPSYAAALKPATPATPATPVDKVVATNELESGASAPNPFKVANLPPYLLEKISETPRHQMPCGPWHSKAPVPEECYYRLFFQISKIVCDFNYHFERVKPVRFNRFPKQSFGDQKYEFWTTDNSLLFFAVYWQEKELSMVPASQLEKDYNDNHSLQPTALEYPTSKNDNWKWSQEMIDFFEKIECGTQTFAAKAKTWAENFGPVFIQVKRFLKKVKWESENQNRA